MTIDEAITQAREKAKEIRENIIDGDNLEPYESYCNTMVAKSAEEHEQLAEWLEELKVYQQHEIICNKGYNAGYNKAIDDFLEAIDRADREEPLILDMYEIEQIAEQLKRGAENEQSI